jgi:hypothetical protein
MTKIEDDKQDKTQEELTTIPVLAPSCCSGTNAAPLSEQGATDNIELSLDYLRTNNVVQLSTRVKLKFLPKETSPKALWGTVWKLIKHYILHIR